MERKMKRAERFYRDFTESARWISSRVRIETSDLYIRADKDLSGTAEEIIRRLRKEIRDHIERQDTVHTSLTPVERLDGCPAVVSMMHEASEQAGVGPMAAVAGAVAEMTGRELADHTEELIIENGGDIWMKLSRPAVVIIYPGGHYFDRVALRIQPERTPCGICTSSARIGLSFSFGRADAATVIAPDAALADAIATEVCNRVKSEDDMESAASYGIDRGACGVIIVYRDRLVARGDVELTDPDCVN
jgi:ApbE superfamily uncharacterized protein (UPF0280 family)